MNTKMQKARLLAENIDHFIKFVYKNYEKEQNSLVLNRDKLYQLKLFVEEFKFQVLADELLRINQFAWDEKYTYLLVGRFKKGLNVIDEFVENNYNDLFIFTARLYTLKSLSMLYNEND
ncbi:hypothetical protein [Bacillus sp. Marseille-P3661]|uniref:hypothetical protein n=1 Tax=Bacillus sp. Marseille-P3661 TaxID=1936234 RepID=UPI000C85DB36|nr:hypothetical protein [Bacillus sp. Marseille-P3661]